VRRLNRTYRGKDAPTNVLSFPSRGPAPDDGAYLGDVVLAAETVRQEAVELGIEPGHHLQHLVVHGLLHLLGHDHQADAAAEEMERLEVEILATIGVADPYAAAATP
jgi:probable rRNA maturation factor